MFYNDLNTPNDVIEREKEIPQLPKTNRLVQSSEIHWI